MVPVVSAVHGTRPAPNLDPARSPHATEGVRPSPVSQLKRPAAGNRPERKNMLAKLRPRQAKGGSAAPCGKHPRPGKPEAAIAHFFEGSFFFLVIFEILYRSTSIKRSANFLAFRIEAQLPKICGAKASAGVNSPVSTRLFDVGQRGFIGATAGVGQPTRSPHGCREQSARSSRPLLGPAAAPPSNSPGLGEHIACAD